MPDAERLTVTLPSDLARAMHAKVREGRYISVEELVYQAILFWTERERLLNACAARIDEADADTRPSLSDEAVGRHFDERLTRSLMRHGTDG